MSGEALGATFVEPRGMVRVLWKAKRDAFKPNPTDEKIASAPRGAVRTPKVDKGRIAGALDLSFEDGPTWAFDVPKVHLKGAEQIAAELGTGG